MVDIDTITRDMRQDIREQAATHMLDAIECITDDHVRRHAADPWWDLLAGPDPVGGWLDTGSLRDRAEAAIKSLTAAIADLDSVDDRVGKHVGQLAGEYGRQHGLPGSIDLRWQPPRDGRPGQWRWTCDLCDQARIFVGPFHDPTGAPNLIDLAAAHAEHCEGDL